LSKKITLTCAVCANRNYTINKNKSKLSIRLEANKYCNNCGTHTLHRETK